MRDWDRQRGGIHSLAGAVVGCHGRPHEPMTRFRRTRVACKLLLGYNNNSQHEEFTTPGPARGVLLLL